MTNVRLLPPSGLKNLTVRHAVLIFSLHILCTYSFSYIYSSKGVFSEQRICDRCMPATTLKGVREGVERAGGKGGGSWVIGRLGIMLG